MFSADSDIQLWQEVRSGNSKSFDKLFERYADFLYNYGIKFGAAPAIVEDSIQDFFLYLWQKRTQLNIQDSPKFYFLRSYRRILLKKIARQKKGWNPFVEQEHPFLIELSQESIQIEEEIELEQKQHLQIALQKLSPRQKEAIFLRYYENFDNEEIAAIMNISLGSLYKLISAAIQKLRKQL